VKHIYDDGGRAESGRKGSAGDCVARAVAIVTGKPYGEVYELLAEGAGNERCSRGRTARSGIHTARKWFKDAMVAMGFKWTATMGIGTGCTVHLRDGELPMGKLVVAVSRHMVAVIDGVIRDTFDPSRGGTRCVYGYWELA
jgi:hypothetical protein